MFSPACAVVHKCPLFAHFLLGRHSGIDKGGKGGGGGGAQLPNEHHACEKMKSEEEIAPPPKLLLGLCLWAGKVNSRRPVNLQVLCPYFDL